MDDTMILSYNSVGVEVDYLRRLLIFAGFSATTSENLRTIFDWHLYVRVLQFQIQMVKKNSSWSIADVDGRVGPKTWSALRAIKREYEQPSTETPAEPIAATVDVVRESPNFSERGATVSAILLHNTAGSYDGSVNWLCNPAAKVSAHLVISRGGHTTQLVPFGKKAWHAGNGRVNANSIGIEIEATNSQQGLTPVQEKKVIAWVKHLMRVYGISAENVLIHRWVSNTDCPVLIWKTDDEFRAWRKRNIG